MAHYAILDENNKVIEVIVGIDENDINTLPDEFDSWETFYGNLKNKTCKRTSYNTILNTHKLNGIPFRGNYAGLGFTYDDVNDIFIPPKPYESWELNETIWGWNPPIPYPDDENMYEWNENTQTWDLIIS